VPTDRSYFPARNKNRKAPIETEISIKTASRGDGFHRISAETLNKNRISIKTASAPPSSCSNFDPRYSILPISPLSSTSPPSSFSDGPQFFQRREL
jgi:hypothetical protein